VMVDVREPEAQKGANIAPDSHPHRDMTPSFT
jgi:hypothetical protein